MAGLALAIGPAGASSPMTFQVQPQRNHQHDFDWEFGCWKTTVRLLRNPLSGQAPDWAEYQGTSLVRPVLGGRFNQVELNVRGPAGEIVGSALRLYQAQKDLWTLNYANARNGLLTAPVGGSFDRSGRGTFEGDDMLDGHPIKVRFIITHSSHHSAHFEQSYSKDQGATWELNWIADDALMGSVHGKCKLPTLVGRARN